MENFHSSSEREKFCNILTILLLGAVWGLLELMFGHYLQPAFLPLKGAVLTGLGMGVMGLSYGVNSRPMLPPIIALATAAAMLLAVPVLNCSPLCRANSMLAVSLHGATIGLAMALAKGRASASFIRLGLLGMAAAIGSSMLFYPLGVNLAPCRYLISFGSQGGAFAFLLKEGFLWGAFSFFLFPAGVTLGKALRRPLGVRLNRTPGFFYASSSLSLALCLGLMILCLRAGF